VQAGGGYHPYSQKKGEGKVKPGTGENGHLSVGGQRFEQGGRKKGLYGGSWGSSPQLNLRTSDFRKGGESLGHLLIENHDGNTCFVLERVNPIKVDGGLLTIETPGAYPVDLTGGKEERALSEKALLKSFFQGGE